MRSDRRAAADVSAFIASSFSGSPSAVGQGATLVTVVA
jgi:hypothetical protein